MKKLCGGIAIFGLGLAILAPSVLAQDPGKEVLKITLPKPMFVGTPKNIRTPNLEMITGKARGPFMVPVGTVLLSAGKPVTASDKEPVIGEISYITDGKKSGEDGYYVELGPMLQWVQIDLAGCARGPLDRRRSLEPLRGIQLRIEERAAGLDRKSVV
jgi:hypothetical protein